ncbi:MAG: concanavalin A-like lectin/glucanase domain-containing protein [Linnemannia gamsii]|nr:MAG: concanavalin A-like lectin/glucanase domain-containing protein [Linnemannia gamsii]
MSIARSNGLPTSAPPGSSRPPHPSKPYSCGQMVNRNRGVGYGKYSIDMIPTDVVGHVTAFFLITHGATPSGEGSEIDIELTGLNSTVVWLNIWKGATQHPVKVPLGFDASKGWHNYAIEWQPGFIAWSVDGKEILKRTDIGTVDPRLPGVEYRLSMNSWTHDVVDQWAGKFKWPASRSAVTGKFRNVKFTPTESLY